MELVDRISGRDHLVRRIRYALAALAACSFIPLLAQIDWIHNDLRVPNPSLYLEVWNGQGETSSPPKTVLFIEHSPSDLVFSQDKEQFRASFSLEVSVVNDDGQLLDRQVQSGEITAEHYEETNRPEWNRLFRFTFNLPEGEYNTFVRLTDENINRDAVGISRILVDHTPQNQLVDASDIMLARRETVDGENGQKQTILPFPAAVYGVDLPRMFFFFEIYNRDCGEEDTLNYHLSYITPDDQQVLIKSVETVCKTEKMPVLYSLDTGELAPGVYRLLLELDVPHGGFQLVRERNFLVYQLPTDLRFRSFGSVLSELRLMAGAEEFAQLEETPEIERQAALDNFWRRHDPTPETAVNELMIEFYNRLSTARYLYDEGLHEDDLSDRAKVFVMFGQPAEVSSGSLDRFQGQFETWDYPEKQLRVVFQDEFGFGKFQLIAPVSVIQEF